MTVGIDADGVLLDYVRTCARFVNDFYKFNKPIVYEDTTDFDPLKAWGVLDAKPEVDAYFSSKGVVFNMPVLFGAREFISAVRDLTDDDFVIITACPSSWHHEREMSLLENFDIPRKKVHFSHDKSMFKVDALVDDYHQNFNGVTGWRILMDRPWNQDTEGVACQRTFGYIDTLEEIVKIVKWKEWHS